MASNPSRPSKPSQDPWEHDTWLNPLPVPEVKEGGESTWDAWHEAARELEAAFAPTQPSAAAPLGAEPERPMPRHAPPPVHADALMVVARRNNRVCPRPVRWAELYQLLEGDRYQDLQPPPVERYVWTSLSQLQKRLRFREHVEWAERHGKLAEVARFMDGLAEADWLHMGEQ